MELYFNSSEVAQSPAGITAGSLSVKQLKLGQRWKRIPAWLFTPPVDANITNNNTNTGFHSCWQVVKRRRADIDCDSGQLSAVI